MSEGNDDSDYIEGAFKLTKDFSSYTVPKHHSILYFKVCWLAFGALIFNSKITFYFI